MGPCSPRLVAVSVEMCSCGLAVFHRMGFCFWIYCQWNRAENPVLVESSRCLNIFVPLPLLLPLLALRMQQRTEQWAPCRNQMFCFLSSFLSELPIAFCQLGRFSWMRRALGCPSALFCSILLMPRGVCAGDISLVHLSSPGSEVQTPGALCCTHIALKRGKEAKVSLYS